MDAHKPSHILNAKQFDRKYLDNLFELIDTIRRFDKSKDGCIYLQKLLAHKRAILYFTQPSTRTFLSFQSACQILGIQTSEIRDSSTSSEFKGESIEDSMRTFSSYVDLIIMRSPIAGLCDRIADMLDGIERPVPVINAGSGPDEHPTQALLDMYTLYRTFKKQGSSEIKNKTICMVGDLKRGRTVRSLSRLLTNYENMNIIFSSPEEFRINDDLRQVLKSHNIRFEETTNFDDAIAAADAIYMTRVQDEYDSNGESKSIDVSKYHFGTKHLDVIKKDCVILHPMPRRAEIEFEVDKDPRALYWRQERNGMWTRVALITQLLNVDHKIVLPQL